ncbi:formyl-coenzyme A transferase [compost metagenome]
MTLAGSTDALFANNCHSINRPDLIDDERFCTNPKRVCHAHLLNQIFADWCVARPLEEVLTAFHASGGTIAPIYAVDQIFDDPQMKARGFLRNVADDDFGSVRMQDVVPRFTNDPCHVMHTAGGLGRDNDELYGVLGLTPDDLHRLRSMRVI